jgi:hypothetical protein
MNPGLVVAQVLCVPSTEAVGPHIVETNIGRKPMKQWAEPKAQVKHYCTAVPSTRFSGFVWLLP